MARTALTTRVSGMRGWAQEQIDEALASGMDDYLVKPYERAAMLAMVARYLQIDGPIALA